MRRAVTLIAVVASFCIAFTSTASADTYRSYSNHFSIVLPDGWMQASADRVNAKTSPTGMGQRYEVAFKRNATRDIQLPYALVQYQGKAITLKQLEREAARLLSGDLSVPGGSGMPTISQLQISSNEKQQRITMTCVLTAPRGGQIIHLTSYSFVGSKGVTSIHCYSDPASKAALAPTFAAIADGFAYDQGYGPTIDTATRQTTRHVLTGLFLVVIVAVLAYVLKKSVAV